MRKLLHITLALFLYISLSCATFAEESFDQITDTFYGGLAEIITHNMNNPDACVKKVDDYYNNNKETINQIRTMSRRYMAQAKAMMETYEWTEAEGAQLEALDTAELEKGLSSPQHAPGANKYIKAMDEFASKHPEHAVRIVMKAGELAPRFENE